MTGMTLRAAAALSVSSVVAVVLLATGCGSTGEKTSAPPSSFTSQGFDGAGMVAWWSAAQESYDAWTGDLTSIGAAGDAGDVDALGSACRSLGDDAGAFSGHLPSPDARLTEQLAAAARYAAEAAADCSVQDYTSASRQISLMTSSIAAATARIQSLTAQ